MGQRQEAEEHIGIIEVDEVRESLERRQHVFVRQDDSFGNAGGAAGVHHDGGVLRGGRHGLHDVGVPLRDQLSEAHQLHALLVARAVRRLQLVLEEDDGLYFGSQLKDVLELWQEIVRRNDHSDLSFVDSVRDRLVTQSSVQSNN